MNFRHLLGCDTIEGQLIELSKRASVAIVTNFRWRQKILPVLFHSLHLKTKSHLQVIQYT